MHDAEGLSRGTNLPIAPFLSLNCPGGKTNLRGLAISEAPPGKTGPNYPREASFCLSASPIVALAEVLLVRYCSISAALNLL